MSIDSGKYFIQNLGPDNLWVGVGPVPPVWPPYPSPLRAVNGYIKDTYEVKSVGGDNYVIKHKTLDMVVGYGEDGVVKLVRQGGKEVKWAIDRGNGEGRFRIKLPDGDKYWTAPEANMDYITLRGDNGDSKQEWKFKEV